MPIVVRSPYSGQPVKVRDQDLGRSLRDEEGRVFYVVERSDGQGYYTAPTRKGSEKDEQRYLDLERKVAEQGEVAATVQRQPVHDATGPGRPVSPVRVVLLVLVILAAIAMAALFLLPEEMGPWQSPPPAPDPTPTEPGVGEGEEPTSIDLEWRDGAVVVRSGVDWAKPEPAAGMRVVILLQMERT